MPHNRHSFLLIGALFILVSGQFSPECHAAERGGEVGNRPPSFGAETLEFPAKLVCGNKRFMVDGLYGTFMGTGQLMKGSYVGFYQSISNDVNEKLAQECKTDQDAKTINLNAEDACSNSCQTRATSFFKDKVLFKESKIQELSTECKLLCRVNSLVVWNYILGASEATENAKKCEAKANSVVQNRSTGVSNSAIKKLSEAVGDVEKHEAHSKEGSAR